MLKLKNIVILSVALFPILAFAQWSTKTDDDIFTGGKKATMIATISDNNTSNAFIFDCTKNDLTFSYIEKSDEPSKVPAFPIDMVVKIDSGEILKMKSAFDQRNDQYIEASVKDKDTVIQLLREASIAKTKMIVGLSNDTIGQISFSGNMSGSGRAVNQFVTACEINIK